MILGVLKEPGFETRVSLLPETVSALIKKNIQVVVEEGAGANAFAADADYALRPIAPRPKHLQPMPIIQQPEHP